MEDARSKLQRLVDVANFEKNRKFVEFQKTLNAKIKEMIDEGYQAAKEKLKADRKELLKMSKERFVTETLVIRKLQEANKFLQRSDALDVSTSDIIEECELLGGEIATIMGKESASSWYEDALFIAKRIPWIGRGKFIPSEISLGRVDWEVDDLDIETSDSGSSDSEVELEENGQEIDEFTAEELREKQAFLEWQEEEEAKALVKATSGKTVHEDVCTTTCGNRTPVVDCQEDEVEDYKSEEEDNEDPSDGPDSIVCDQEKLITLNSQMKEHDENGQLWEIIPGMADLDLKCPQSEPVSSSGVTGNSGGSILQITAEKEAKKMRPYHDYRCHDFDRVQEPTSQITNELANQEQVTDKDELNAFNEQISRMKPVKNIFANSVRDVYKEAAKAQASSRAFVPFMVTRPLRERPASRDPFEPVRTPRTISVCAPESSQNTQAHHAAKHIDITNSRHADLKAVVNDHFNKPMGIGGGQGKVFIPNSGERGAKGEVFIYNLAGNYIATLVPPEKGFCTATSIIEVKKQNCKLYLVKDNFKVYVFEEKELDPVALKAHAEFQYSFSLENLGKMPVGLCYIDEHLYIANDDCNLSKVTLRGSLVETYQLNWRRCAQLSKKPRIRYANHFNKSIYLPCMANFKVIQSSTDGIIKRVFGDGFGSNVSQMKQPAGLTFDAVGNFIVADSKNHRLLIFDYKTGKSRTLQYQKKFSRPSDVHLHDNGVLCVSSLDGNVYLMEVQGAALKK